jgi:hypothetical protein
VMWSRSSSQGHVSHGNKQRGAESVKLVPSSVLRHKVKHPGNSTGCPHWSTIPADWSLACKYDQYSVWLSRVLMGKVSLSPIGKPTSSMSMTHSARPSHQSSSVGCVSWANVVMLMRQRSMSIVIYLIALRLYFCACCEVWCIMVIITGLSQYLGGRVQACSLMLCYNPRDCVTQAPTATIVL